MARFEKVRPLIDAAIAPLHSSFKPGDPLGDILIEDENGVLVFTIFKQRAGAFLSKEYRRDVLSVVRRELAKKSFKLLPWPDGDEPLG